MKLKTTLLAACAAALISSTATAALSLSVTSTVTHTGGPDTFGFDGSTWTLTYNSSQDNYVDTFGLPSVITDSAFLTVSGAGDNNYNGTFAITETNTTNFASFPNVGNMLVGFTTGGGFAEFGFGPGPAMVSGLGISGSSQSTPSPGDPIELSDFQGASVSDLTFAISGGDFTFAPGTVNASTVPEPSTYAALAGLAALGFVVLRRRK